MLAACKAFSKYDWIFSTSWPYDFSVGPYWKSSRGNVEPLNTYSLIIKDENVNAKLLSIKFSIAIHEIKVVSRGHLLPRCPRAFVLLMVTCDPGIC